jgi:hypothetical protein
MSLSARAASRLAAIVGVLLFAGVAPAGPLVQTGPYDLTLGDGSKYRISGKVETGGVGFVYTYSVRLLNTDIAPRLFELGIAESPTIAGLHSESSPTVLPGPGTLLHDLQPHASTPGPNLHNYVWTFLRDNHRVGIPILAGHIQVMSFEDTHAPGFADWSLRQVSPGNLIAYSTFRSLGELPVPALDNGVPRAPEPSSLTLAVLGIAGAGLAFRRRRKAATSTAA